MKHGIAFEEAATTWLDANAIEAHDEAHSRNEDRWLRIGMSLRGLVLVTWSAIRLFPPRHCPVEGEKIVRIIGSRRAIKTERKLHEEAWL